MLWILIWFIQSRSLYFVLSSTSACIIFIQFVTDCRLCKKTPTHKQTIPKNKLKQTPNPNQKVGKNSFCLFCSGMELCCLVFLFSSDTVDTVIKMAVIMELTRYSANTSSLTYLGVYLSSFGSVSSYSELRLLCAHLLYSWQGVLSSG